MTLSSNLLLLSAGTIGMIHTIIGPDHYLPFIVLGRAEGWTFRKTLVWTGICGIGHILSSIILGLIGVGLGWALSSMQQFENIRGQIAGVALIVFGSAYFLWGLYRAKKGHSHVHVHPDGSIHTHPHPHEKKTHPIVEHQPILHDEPKHIASHQRTVWVLFTIFVLGPCEPLIPLFMAPASRHDLSGVLTVAISFGLVTILTMMAMVSLGTYGIRMIRLNRLERYAHALAGFAILTSGLLIQLFGL